VLAFALSLFFCVARELQLLRGAVCVVKRETLKMIPSRPPPTNPEYRGGNLHEAEQLAAAAAAAEAEGKQFEALDMLRRAISMLEGSSQGSELRKLAEFRARAAMLEAKIARSAATTVASAAKTGQDVITKANETTKKGGGLNTMAAAAGVGAVAGAVLMGPVTAVVGAGMAAYATTRDDDVGKAARITGQTAVTGVTKAREFDKEHDLTTKASRGIKAVWSKGKALNEEHKIAERAGSAGKKLATSLSEMNAKYDLTGKIGKGLSKGFDKLIAACESKPPGPKT